MTARASVFVTFREPGFHRWPDAPEWRSYLKSKHRHLFHIKVSTEVTHDDRELEFHDLIDRARSMWKQLVPGEQVGSMSCEVLARSLAAELVVSYRRSFIVSVSEDGEAGAEVQAWEASK